MENFKESGFMYGLAAFVIGFVVLQSVFFIVKAWKRAKELGISKETLKNTVISSTLFTIAPAISILTTVIVLASALGTVLPEGGLLKGLSQVRYISHGALIPLLLPICAYALGMKKTGKTVVTGPIEGAAFGNILMQQIACGEISSLEEGRKEVADSVELSFYRA